MVSKTYTSLVSLVIALSFLNTAFCGEIDEALQKLEGLLGNVKITDMRLDKESAKELGALRTRIMDLVGDNEQPRAFLIQEIRRHASTKRDTSPGNSDFSELRRSYVIFDALVDILQATDEDGFVDLSVELMGRESVDPIFKDHMFRVLFIGHRIWLKVSDQSKLIGYDRKIEPLAVKSLKDMKMGNTSLSEALMKQLLESLAGYDHGLSLPAINRHVATAYMRRAINNGRPFEEKVWYYKQLAKYDMSDRATFVHLLREYVCNKDHPIYFRARYARDLHGMGEIDQETMVDIEKQAEKERENRVKRYEKGKGVTPQSD